MPFLCFYIALYMLVNSNRALRTPLPLSCTVCPHPTPAKVQFQRFCNTRGPRRILPSVFVSMRLFQSLALNQHMVTIQKRKQCKRGYHWSQMMFDEKEMPKSHPYSYKKPWNLYKTKPFPRLITPVHTSPLHLGLSIALSGFVIPNNGFLIFFLPWLHLCRSKSED